MLREVLSHTLDMHTIELIDLHCGWSTPTWVGCIFVRVFAHGETDCKPSSEVCIQELIISNNRYMYV